MPVLSIMTSIYDGICILQVFDINTNNSTIKKNEWMMALDQKNVVNK